VDTRYYDSIEVLDELIVGRVEPKIYAFTTNTIPNYLKVGDTCRPVNIRLKEWEKEYPSLKKEYESPATINDDVYFRDYSVHKYLEGDLNKHRLCEDEVESNVRYSNEFFRNTSVSEVQDAVSDIQTHYDINSGKYSYYRTQDMRPTDHQYQRGSDWELRPNQQEVVENFKTAVFEKGRTNLLMYAVMRFGKSFTSLCCGLAMQARLILVVSAKADVQEEWKKTVESAGNFKDYVYLNANDLASDENKLKDSLEVGNAVVFLTLQDLQGEEIKEKHKEIFENQIDLLIVDETHFGARAESFGAVLRPDSNELKNLEKLEDEFVSPDEADEEIKLLKSKVRIHLSGTPYRILMGSEFEKEDIISFVQFTDIVHEKECWDEANLYKDNVEEWDNPYYGFPQMLRFAFLPNELSVRKMQEKKEAGISFNLSKLLEPQSIKKDNRNNKHKKFIYHDEVLALLKAIDGTEYDDNIFGFLDYDKIKEGQMCRHMVMVLPYCASCDAMQQLLSDYRSSFKNLSDYEIINISGVDSSNSYRRPLDIKRTISSCEAEGKKTITLTVNRMLTGSTVEEWDTMIFLKETASPQEYDQATFRLQNQYVRTLVSGDEIIKENLKPQTLLVDFHPNRLFVLQEQKSLIFNVNTDERGNLRLKERLDDELRISPIIVLNENQIQQVTSTDILEIISEYNSERSISDETTDIPIDMSLLHDELIKSIIERQPDFNSKAGLSFSAHDGEETEFDLDDSSESEEEYPDEIDDALPFNEDSAGHGHEIEDGHISQDRAQEINYHKKFQTYYQRILFYSFLVNMPVYSLDDVINTLGDENNSRILKNLGLHKTVLSKIAEQMDPFIRNSLDYKIQNISQLAFDESKTPLDRALTSLNKFNRLSESEIITPKSVSDEMVNLIPDSGYREIIEQKKVFLDIASKAAEYSVSIYKKLIELGYEHDDIKSKIYAIPTSPIAYELTRKFYEILDLNLHNIAYEFNSYDLLEVKRGNRVDYEKVRDILQQDTNFNEIKTNEEIIIGGSTVEFGAVVGNPPYQVSDGGAQASSKPIYQHFVMISELLQPKYSSFIMPTRWYAGGKGLNAFRNYMLHNSSIVELHDITTPEDIFPVTHNRGGVCYLLMDKDKTDADVKIYTHRNNQIVALSVRQLKIEGLDIFIRDSVGIEIIEKVKTKEEVFFSDYISSLRPFGFRGYFTDSDDYHHSPKNLSNPVKCYGKGMREGYVERELITKSKEYIDVWKVFIARANNIATELNDDNLNTHLGRPNEICTETYLMVGADLGLNNESALNLGKYFATKFARYMHSLAKPSQDSTSKTFRFVPVQDFTNTSDIDWSKPIEDIDKQLFDKYALTAEEREHINSSIKPME
jgi:hypothetical protein